MGNEAIRELAEKAWNGQRAEVQAATQRPGTVFELAGNVILITGFGNSIVFRTGEGLVVVDTSGRAHADAVVAALRSWDTSPVRTVVYTHGHFDHVGGMPAFDADAEQRGYPKPRVIAHKNVSRRLDRYAATAGYNTAINRRQFGPRPAATTAAWTSSRYPDESFETSTAFEVGGMRFELFHARGETDDHAWVWVPQLAMVCAGDFFIWNTPNAGNPQKVQRWPREWAEALRAMAALRPQALVPSHYVPVFGAERVEEALVTTATLLEGLVDDCLVLMNRGARLDELIHSVRVPAELLSKPYLVPLYDEPEFIVHNVWRLYGGWYDGNPANLKPAPEPQLASELASLAGGAQRLADRAGELAQDGQLRLAGHLAEFAALAAPDDPTIQAARAAVFNARAEAEASLMSRGIFRAAAQDSEALASGGTASG